MVWTALRPEAMISSDPDLSGGLNDGLLSGDFAATNLGMAGGQVDSDKLSNINNQLFQWIFFFLVWMGFLFANSSSGQARSGEAREVSVEDRQLGSSEIMRSEQIHFMSNFIDNLIIRALDDLFTPSTVTKQSVVNILGVNSVCLLSFLEKMLVVLGSWWNGHVDVVGLYCFIYIRFWYSIFSMIF